MIDLNPRRAAGLIKQHLIEELGRLQARILIVERFGEHAVTLPMLGSMGTDDLVPMLQRHAELVETITALTKALDRAGEVDMADFVADIIRRRREGK